MQQSVLNLTLVSQCCLSKGFGILYILKSKMKIVHWAWWGAAVMTAIGQLRQENCLKLAANLSLEMKLLLLAGNRVVIRYRSRTNGDPLPVPSPTSRGMVSQ